MLDRESYRRRMPITFDTTGLQPRPDGGWVDPQTGDGVSLIQSEGPPFTASWMSDEAVLKRGFAGMFAGNGVLLECELIPFGGARAVYQLVKMPIPHREHGLLVVATFTLTKATRYAQLMYHGIEHGTTGVREAVVMMRLGMPDDWALPTPYAPGLKTKLPALRSDDPAWDAQFPEHPLSRVRLRAEHLRRTARVDPAWAALPELGA